MFSHFTMKINETEMTEIIEKCVKEYNQKQRITQFVAVALKKAGQDPWQDCKQEF